MKRRRGVDEAATILQKWRGREEKKGGKGREKREGKKWKNNGKWRC